MYVRQQQMDDRDADIDDGPPVYPRHPSFQFHANGSHIEFDRRLPAAVGSIPQYLEDRLLFLLFRDLHVRFLPRFDVHGVKSGSPSCVRKPEYEAEQSPQRTVQVGQHRAVEQRDEHSPYEYARVRGVDLVFRYVVQ